MPPTVGSRAQWRKFASSLAMLATLRRAQKLPEDRVSVVPLGDFPRDRLGHRVHQDVGNRQRFARDDVTAEQPHDLVFSECRGEFLRRLGYPASITPSL
jgi:hypothetical protein